MTHLGTMFADVYGIDFATLTDDERFELSARMRRSTLVTASLASEWQSRYWTHTASTYQDMSDDTYQTFNALQHY